MQYIYDSCKPLTDATHAFSRTDPRVHGWQLLTQLVYRILPDETGFRAAGVFGCRPVRSSWRTEVRGQRH